MLLLEFVGKRRNQSTLVGYNDARYGEGYLLRKLYNKIKDMEVHVTCKLVSIFSQIDNTFSLLEHCFG
jgi:hypothetical protein